MGISAHNLPPLQCTTTCAPQLLGRLEMEKREETSLVLLEKCPQTTEDIWQDSRCRSLLPVLTVPTMGVAVTPVHAWLCTSSSHLHPFCLDG